MPRLPKLKLKKTPLFPHEEIRDLEEAKDFLPFVYGVLIVVEGHEIKSYEELVQLASQDGYRDKEFLEVEVLLFLTIPGG